jgi:hypothetical protein
VSWLNTANALNSTQYLSSVSSSYHSSKHSSKHSSIHSSIHSGIALQVSDRPPTKPNHELCRCIGDATQHCRCQSRSVKDHAEAPNRTLLRTTKKTCTSRLCGMYLVQFHQLHQLHRHRLHRLRRLHRLATRTTATQPTDPASTTKRKCKSPVLPAIFALQSALDRRAHLIYQLAPQLNRGACLNPQGPRHQPSAR